MHEPLPSSLSQRIVRFREDRSWSQARLGRESGVPASTLADWGKEGAIDEIADRLRALATAMGMSLAELLGDPAPPPALRPGDWILDEEMWDIAKTGEELPKGVFLACPIPPRFRILSPREYAAVKSEADDAMSRRHRRKKPT